MAVISAGCVERTLRSEGACPCGECPSEWYWSLFRRVVGQAAFARDLQGDEVLGVVWVYFLEHSEYVARNWSAAGEGKWGEVLGRAKHRAMRNSVDRAILRGFRDYDHAGREIASGLAHEWEGEFGLV